MPEQVFISSTCYDLIDIRAELESYFRDMQLTPILSDRPTSEFSLSQDANSIEMCLANVRSADYFVIILSQRYGPSLSSAGYEDLSATHLEYREARQSKKPIYMYVRDRLEADYALYKKNPDAALKYSWVKAGDENIFGLLEEHRRLSAESSESNWLWTFRDSTELKQRIRHDFKDSAGKAILQKLMDQGRVAFLIPSVDIWELDKKSREIRFDMKVSNAGTAVAIQPYISINFGGKHEDLHIIETLIPGQSYVIKVALTLSVASFKSKEPEMLVECLYTTPEGHTIADETKLEFHWYPGAKELFPPIATYECKRYLHSAGIRLKIRDEK